MMCAGNAFNKIHEQLLMHNDGTVNWNVPYERVCDALYANVAYNNEIGDFGVHNDTGVMKMRKEKKAVESELFFSSSILF